MNLLNQKFPLMLLHQIVSRKLVVKWKNCSNYLRCFLNNLYHLSLEKYQFYGAVSLKCFKHYLISVSLSTQVSDLYTFKHLNANMWVFAKMTFFCLWFSNYSRHFLCLWVIQQKHKGTCTENNYILKWYLKTFSLR